MSTDAEMQQKGGQMNIALLKSEMEKRGMNATELAKASGVSKATLSRILRGQRGCTTNIAKQIVQGMKLTQKQALMIFFG